jgi:hypothetical protein
MGKLLGFMNIENTKIFSINNNNKSKTINVITSNCSKIVYIEITKESFIEYLNNDNNNFLVNNRNTVYILRDSNFLNIKHLFTTINNFKINIGTGRSQKNHVLSNLDLRLSSYLLAMYNFDYKLLNNINAFNIISKDRYLS